MDSRPAATPGSSQEYEHNESPTAAAEPPAVAEKRILKQSIPSESIPTVRSLSDHGQPTALSPDHPALSETLGVPNESIILHSVPPQRDTTLPSTAEQSAFADVIGIQSHATPQQSVKNARIERPGEAVDDTSALSPVVRNISHSADHPLPGSNASDEPRPLPRARTIDRDLGRYPSAIDWIVPVEEKAPAKSKFLTIGERLEPTLIKAQFERNKYSVKAKVTGYSLNAAIGLQVLLGSLTTGVAAAASSGRQLVKFRERFEELLGNGNG
ncbi:hypothetical protein H0H87_000587 [Tephrocybe sp. NHM501043]|nr:hypothetical protein H0H87_000587 [Tephrocybe sp. NHM501043]